MHNDILTIGPVTIHGYGLMIAIGILAAVLLAGFRAKRKGLSADTVYSLGIVALIFGFVGAKLLYCVVEWRYFIENPLRALSGQGFVIYGGILGGVTAAIIYCRVKKLSFIRYFDLVAPSLALAQGFGRIGCLLAGCCYGRETDSIFGIVFRHSLYAPNGVRLIPTQIMHSAGNFIIAAVLLLYARKDRKVGRVGAIYLILYSVTRFSIEFFRGDYRGVVGVLSTSQFISIIMLIVGVGLFFMDKLPFVRKRTDVVEPKDTDRQG